VLSAQAAYATTTRATIPEEVQKAQLDVDQAGANLEVANRTAEERKRLLQEGAISGRDTDTSIAAAVQAKATYEAAVKHLQSVNNTTRKTDEEASKGQLTSAQGRLMNAETQVTYANLRSPIDGIVTERPLFPGETASAGSSVITVMDTSSLLAKLHIAQSSAQKLKIGGSAQVFIPGIGAPQAATVALISPALDPGSTTVEVWLKLPNADGRYKVGTPVHAVLQGITIPDAIQVPAAAILPADDGSTNVLIVEPDGAAKKRSVKVGLRTTDKVQIVEGVSPADLVITEGGYGLDDGTKVKVGSSKGDETQDRNSGSAPEGAKD
jgi:multidrug efflux pump subunit AcrA (membrane-fusion protein)